MISILYRSKIQKSGHDPHPFGECRPWLFALTEVLLFLFLLFFFLLFLPVDMIDGIINNGPKEPTVAQLEQQARSGQPISLMDLAAAAHREEREKKKSVMEQLKSQPKAEHKKTAPKKSAEREI